jgi:hypothetical protein
MLLMHVGVRNKPTRTGPYFLKRYPASETVISQQLSLGTLSEQRDHFSY